MVKSLEVSVIAKTPEVVAPKWKRVVNKTYPAAYEYEGKATHEDVAFLVDPLKVLADWQAWAKEEMVKQYEEKCAAEGAVPLRLRVYAGYTKVLWGLLEYPAVRVEAWHHGSPQLLLIVAGIASILIAVLIGVYLIFQKATEIDWKPLAKAVAVGGVVILALLALALLPKKKEER